MLKPLLLEPAGGSRRHKTCDPHGGPSVSDSLHSIIVTDAEENLAADRSWAGVKFSLFGGFFHDQLSRQG